MLLPETGPPAGFIFQSGEATGKTSAVPGQLEITVYLKFYSDQYTFDAVASWQSYLFNKLISYC